ncbi:MAG: TonB-dependent receptor plug domain-containing protein [Fibrobacterales bacterium]
MTNKAGSIMVSKRILTKLQRSCNSTLLILIYSVCLVIPASANNTALDSLFTIPFEELLNVKVYSPTKQHQYISTVPGIISIITREELQLFGAHTVFEALNRLPNVMSNIGHSINTVSIRGSEFNFLKGNISYLIDGLPIRNIGGNGTYYNYLYTFPINRVKQIEVIRGPGSVQYGNNAFDGVINIITEDAVPEYNVQTNLQIGEYNTRHYGIDAWEQFGDVIVHGNYLLASSDGIALKSNGNHTLPLEPANPAGTITDSPFEIQTPENKDYYFAEIRYKSITLFYQNAYSNKFISHLFNPSFQQVFTEPNAIYTQLNYTSLSQMLGATIKYQLNKNLSVDGSFFRHREIFKWILGSNTLIHTEGIEYNSDARIHYIINKDISIQSGLHYRRLKSDKNTLTIPYDFQYLSFMTELDVVFDKLAFYVGFQYNKPFKYTAALVPRFATLYNLTNKFTIKYSLAQAFRTPNPPEYLYNNFITSPTDSSIVYLDKGNPELKPEIITTNDFQLLYSTSKIVSSLTGYYAIAENLISSHPKEVTIGDTVVTYSNFKDNLDERVSYGVEYEGKFTLYNNWFSTNSITWNQNVFNDSITNFTLSPNYQIKCGISYKVPMFSLSSFVIYSDSYKAIPDDRTPVDVLPLNPSPNAFIDVSAHLQLNIHTIFSLPYPEIKIQVYGRNLLDYKHWQPDLHSYLYNSLPGMEGRNFLIQLITSF